MNDGERGQVTRSAAEVYEEFYLPALFQEWTSLVVNTADIQSAQRVLDIACGTGVLTIEVADRVGSDGTVIGLDPNEGMLALARRKAPAIEWRQGFAESIPFESNYFDAVVSQFGLMFFEDKLTAIKEMHRVLRPGGRLAVAVWDSLENTPGYAAITDLLQQLFGDEAANAMRAPYSLGDTQILGTLFTDAGVREAEITTHEGTAHFPSISSWVHTDVKGWTLADMIDDDQYQRLLKEAEQKLLRFVTSEGKVAFPAPAHIVAATKV